MANGQIELKVSPDNQDVAYLSLPEHPGTVVAGIVVKTLRLADLCGPYEGPDIYLDFGEGGRLLGIEILV